MFVFLQSASIIIRISSLVYSVSQKIRATFYDNFGKRGPIFIFFTVKFIKDLRKKKELKLSLPLKSVATLPCET